jgi:DNA polymerase III subunit delta'
MFLSSLLPPHRLYLQPMQFQSITGQKDTKEQLVQMIQHNRLSHALLFLGKEGSGALQLAQAFAQYIVCDTINGKAAMGNKQSANEPSLFGEPEPSAAAHQPPTTNNQAALNDSCGTCPACKKATALIHPDIHFSYPVITKKAGEKPVSADFIKEWRQFMAENPYGNVYDWLQFISAENKQGNITATECNDINRTMSLKSFESEYKILIMWLPEFLGKEGNKLLKLIEEPPFNTLFIFVAENDELILPTILSRTQLVKIPLLTNAEVAASLELKQGISKEKAQQIAAVAEGNYREALQLLQHTEDDWQVLLREWLNAVLKTGPLAQVKWIEDTAKMGREKQKQFLKYFIHLLQQAIRLRVIPPTVNHQPSTDHDFALRLNKICSIAQQEAIITELDKASYYIERNANAKMLFHALSIRLYHIISNKSVILVN